ncbi:MAG TPA: hypothetical protein DCG19_04020 [Cryomorphaceae bacterium]|nr:hypothetical protein [Owenweeksia sp.]HAD96547.1 hypothetical protein [Cryomorphaceae bacterium]
MVSKFNPLFNGEQALLRGETTLREQHKDNFDEILPVYRLGDEQLASNIKPDMEKAIEKGSKVIQEHSMMIRNNQKNKFIDDSYLLIGKARFYQKDYLPALETFNFIVLEFPESRSYQEARLWVARCKTQIGNYLSAKEDFEKLYREEEMPKRLKDDVYASYAQLEINSGSSAAAYQLLRQAIDKTRDKDLEIRWLFIAGQLQSRMGNDYEASQIFEKVIRKGPPYELLFQAQLNRARNYDVELQNPAKAFDQLKAMLRDDKNYENRDQIYYVMAEVAEKLEDEALMEEYLKKSVRVSTTNQKQKSQSYLKLAETNFRNKLYKQAEAYYDSTFTNLQENDPRFRKVKRIKESLNTLVKNLETIETQDSLQALAKLSEEQRNERIDDYIEKLKEEEERKKQKAENPYTNYAMNQPGGPDNAGGPTSGAPAGQWYFYNQSVRGVGVRDFINRFGDRKLEDNWRRKNKENTGNFDEGPNNTATEASGENLSQGDKPDKDPKYSREEYLKNIPLSPEEIAESHKLIQEAFLAVGRVYKDDLNDYDAAAKALEELLGRYPDMEEKGRVWYTLYRVFTLAGDNARASYYRDLILTNMADSEYAAIIQNEGSGLPLTDRSEAKKAYVEAYQKYEDGAYKESLPLATQGARNYQDSRYAPKFQMLKAFNQIKLGKREEFVSSLKLVIDQFSDSEEAEEARSILDQMEGVEVSPAKTADKPEEAQKSIYKAENTAQHKYIVILGNDGKVVNDLRVNLTDFNKQFFNIDNLNTKSIFLDMEHQMILVSNFNNSKRAMDYYNTVTNQNLLKGAGQTQEVQHFVISSDNFQRFYKDKKTETYLEFFRENYLK